MPDWIDWIIFGLIGACLLEGIALIWIVRSERKYIREMRRKFKINF